MPRNHFPAPDPSVLFYQRTRDNGRTEVATMQTIERDSEGGSWRGRFFIPGQAPFFMDQSSGELEKWEPIYAVTQQDITDVIERVAQRVVEILGSKKISGGDIVSSAMEVLKSETVAEAVEKAAETTEVKEVEASVFSCQVCNKTFKYEKSFKKHLQKAHKTKG